MNPLVSILTPSYNQGRFLGYCLESVENQSYKHLEHIVCDGGSTDETQAILKNKSSTLWVSEKDRGQSHALNKAFAMSKGEIIGWLNSDDGYADRRAVEWSVRAFADNPQVDVVFGHALLVNEANDILQVMTAVPFKEHLFKLVNYVVQPTVFIRRRAIERFPWFVQEHLQFVMDRDLWLRLAKQSTFLRIPRVIAIDRHQRARKVESGAYPKELATYDRSQGIARNPSAAKAVKASLRLMGTGVMARLHATLDPAMPLTIPSFRQRMIYQLLTQRKDMPFSPETIT